MSFLAELEHEQLATLEIALALIDECDDSTSSDSTASSSSSGSPAQEVELPSLPLQALDTFSTPTGSAMLESHEADLVFLQPLDASSAHQQQQQQSQQEQSQSNPFAVPPPAAKAPAAKAKSKARSNAGAVARHRERKKAEMISLRSQVGELEAKLAQLQMRRMNRSGALQYLLTQQRNEGAQDASIDEQLTDATDPKAVAIKPKHVSVWLDVAAFQAQERYKSETLNSKLKDAVARQMKVVKALEDVLGKKAHVYGLDLLLETQKQDLRDDGLLAQEDRIFEALRDELKTMYFAADTLFDPQCWAEATESVSCSTQAKTDAVTGETIMEVRTSTPLRCPFQRSGNEMWHRMCMLQTGHEKNYHVKKRVLTDTSFQKCYTMIIDGPDGRPLELRGVSYVEMVEEASRMVWMWRSTLLTTDASGPRFCEKGWIVSQATATAMAPGSPTSVYRVCYQVSCDSRGEGAPRDPHTTALVENVLRTLSARTRAHQQMQQNMLLDEFSGLPIQRPSVHLIG